MGWPGAERPSVPGPESGWGYPLIPLLLVSLQRGCLFGFYPVCALYRLLLVGGPRASHEAPSVEEGWWAPSSGPLPGVFGTLPFAAWLCSTRWSLCHHGWRGSWAGPGDESAEPASVGGIAAALHWHSPRPSYVSSFCALLSFHDIELHGLPIPNAAQKLPGVVSLNSCLSPTERAFHQSSGSQTVPASQSPGELVKTGSWPRPQA